MVEASLRDMILKTFDPKKADTIFSEEGETPAWLTEMIEHPTWRSLVYRLAEEYPDCLMLNFTIKVRRTEKSQRPLHLSSLLSPPAHLGRGERSRDHEHLHRSPADRGLLADAQDVRLQNTPELRGHDGKEHSGHGRE
jgi:hypothetical protein